MTPIIIERDGSWRPAPAIARRPIWQWCQRWEYVITAVVAVAVAVAAWRFL